jgi:asparagine synthase (glutamine-hydrolysing)
MANILIVMDRDGERREKYVREAANDLAPVSGLRTGKCASGPATAIWAASENAPIEAVNDEDGGAVLWGDAIPGPDSRRWMIRELRSAWSTPEIPEPCDGFHAAVVWNKAGEISLGTDLLGVFPLYWWADEEVLLAGSSPELFAKHPRFKARFNPAGLVGILLTNGLVGRKTLWQDVHRLAPGYMLRGQPDSRFSEKLQYELPLSTQYYDLPFAAHVELMGDSIHDAVKRHVPSGQAYGMLISGGLDSRMLAGFLSEQGIHPRALTLGLQTDLEMRCAQGVTRALGIEHLMAEPKADHYPQYATIHARWEHLANGFNTIRDWETQEHIARLAPRVVVGCLADSVLGGTSIAWAWSRNTASMNFASFFSQMPELGVRADVLSELLDSKSVGGLVEETLQSLESEFNGYGNLGSHHAWAYDVRHGQRFHVAGTIWRMSFGAWPVVPMLDRKVLATAAGLPAASLADRLAQLSLLQTRFPRLAELPLDRSDLASDEPQVLAPRLRYMLKQFAGSEFNRMRRKLHLSRLSKTEVRYWYRINNFESDGWRSVRALAEPSRSKVQLFHAPVLDKVLPNPTPQRDGSPQRIQESGRKMLVGFLLWAKDHL